MTDEYYQNQLEIQRNLNKNIVEKFKELETIIKDNNNDFEEKIEKHEIEINYIKSKLEIIREKQLILSDHQNHIFSYNPINYIAAHLFYGFLLYEGLYFASKLFYRNDI